MKTNLKELLNSIGKCKIIEFALVFLILYAIQGLQPHFISILISNDTLYIGITGIILSLLAPRILQFFSNMILQDIRKNSKDVLIGRLLYKDYLYFKENDAGTTIHLIDEVSFTFRAIFNDAILPLLSDIVFLIVSFIILSGQNILIGILFIILFLLYSFISCIILKNNGERITAVIDTSSRLKTILIDVYNNIDSIIVHKSQPFELNRLGSKTNEEKKAYFKLQDRINKANLFINALLIAFLSIIFLFISRLTRNSNLFEVLLVLIYSILNLSNVGTKILAFIEYKDRLDSALNKSQLYCNDVKPIEFASDSKYAIRLDSISYGYEAALRNSISFAINDKEKVAIIGDNGSGKSTLLKVLAGLISPMSGTISYKDDIDTSVDIGYYAQECVLFNRSILENIIYPFDNRSYDIDKVMEIIRKVHLETIVEDSSDLVKIAGDKGNLLSGGEKQKILIARALYENKKIILFDEITSSLDKESCTIFNKLLNDDFRNSTLLIASHELQGLQYTKIINLSEFT